MIQGSLVAIVTPMHPNGRVDEKAFRRLVDWHVEQGTDAIVAVGTTGESATLDEAEHCAAIALVVDQAYQCNRCIADLCRQQGDIVVGLLFNSIDDLQAIEPVLSFILVFRKRCTDH